MRRLTPLLALVLAACASAPVARDIQRSFPMTEATIDDVWPAVIETFGERGWAIDNMERASGLITTDWMSVARETGYMDCGSPGMGVDSNHAVRFNVFVRELDRGARMDVNTSWRAERSVLDTRSLVDCVSTGVLEKEVHEEVAHRISGG